MREYFFDADGVRLRVLQWGNTESAQVEATTSERGPAAIVLLHGFSQSADSWYEVAQLLVAAGHPVYAYDLVGHGGSDKPEDAGAYTLDAQAAALCAFLATLETKPVVVGYSMGGRVALAAACRNPHEYAHLACALVLESAGLGPSTPDERTQAAARDAACAQRLRTEGLVAFMDAWERQPIFETQQCLSPLERERVRGARLANNAEALAKTFERAGQHAMPARAEVMDALQTLVQAGCLVGYVTGQLDEKYVHLATELECKLKDDHDREPGSDSTCCHPDPARDSACAHKVHFHGAVVPDTGHNTHLESPRGFVEALQNCLASFNE